MELILLPPRNLSGSAAERGGSSIGTRTVCSSPSSLLLRMHVGRYGVIDVMALALVASPCGARLRPWWRGRQQQKGMRLVGWCGGSRPGGPPSGDDWEDRRCSKQPAVPFGLWLPRRRRWRSFRQGVWPDLSSRLTVLGRAPGEGSSAGSGRILVWSSRWLRRAMGSGLLSEQAGCSDQTSADPSQAKGRRSRFNEEAERGSVVQRQTRPYL